LVNGLANMTNDSSDFEDIYQRNLAEVRIGWVELLSGFGKPNIPINTLLKAWWLAGAS
jgi:hypothetical protein